MGGGEPHQDRTQVVKVIPQTHRLFVEVRIPGPAGGQGGDESSPPKRRYA